MFPLQIAVYASAIYLFVGTIVYVLGHPNLQGRGEIGLRNSPGTSRRRSIAGRSVIHRQLAHSAQIINFIVNKLSRRRRRPRFASLPDTYTLAVRRAFDPTRHSFITTGSPHARACYPRNFAWFYPTLMDPATVIDRADFKNRMSLTVRSLEMILKVGGTTPYTTTLIPLTRKRMAAVNYVKPPSDSLLGILAGIEQLAYSTARDAASEGLRLLDQYGHDLRVQMEYLLGELKEAAFDGTTCPLLDAEDNRSSATDTRGGKLRFVVAANVWATIARALALQIVNEKYVSQHLGFDLAEYKRRILRLFAAAGYTRNSLDREMDERESSEITLDFAHVHRGFWTFATDEELSAFQATADRIFADSAFADASGDTFFVSRGGIRYGPMHRYTVPGYHGRTVWPNFNVAFAERLLEFGERAKVTIYRDRAERILRGVKNIVAKNGGYPELVDEQGRLYKTWIYRGAMADSWFPYFASVWHKAFGSFR
jgi:hypothetical protein